MFSMSRSTKNIPTIGNVRQLCEELFLLKCIFLLTHCFGYSNNQREATLLQNVKYQKLILRIIDICFFTAILITYIKGGTPAQIVL
jgi:hypothetical protein